MATPTKIDIRSDYADKIRSENKGVQSFVNELLDMYYQKRIVILNAENHACIEEFSQKSGKDINYIANFVLGDVELTLPEPKIKVTIADNKFKTKKKLKVTNKFVTGY